MCKSKDKIIVVKYSCNNEKCNNMVTFKIPEDAHAFSEISNMICIYDGLYMFKEYIWERGNPQ